MTRGLKDIELIASGKRVSAAYRPKAGHDNKQRQRVYQRHHRSSAGFEALHGIREKQRQKIYRDKGEQLYDDMRHGSCFGCSLIKGKAFPPEAEQPVYECKCSNYPIFFLHFIFRKKLCCHFVPHLYLSMFLIFLGRCVVIRQDEKEEGDHIVPLLPQGESGTVQASSDVVYSEMPLNASLVLALSPKALYNDACIVWRRKGEYRG